jgi:hypothetical protein
VLGVCAVAVLLLGLFFSQGPWPFGWVHALDWARDGAAVLAGR